MAPAVPDFAFDFSGFVRQVAIDSGGGDGRLAKLEDSVKSLEEERRKIEAFKRELPLSMDLISNVIEELKKEVERLQGKRFHCALEEFMPINSKCAVTGEVRVETDCKEKMKWMSSAQLWSDNPTTKNNESNKIEDNIIDKNNGRTSDRNLVTENPSLNSKSRSCGSSLLPFEGLPVLALAIKVNEKKASAMPDLSLASPAMKAVRRPSEEEHPIGGLSFQYIGGPKVAPAQLSLQTQQLTTRKARRCWSPELHRRFLCALQQLGGAQVATPKQIRELMKVDGITNDEVKSHLQKYRLHTQRMPNSSVSLQKPTVSMGGLWTPLENCASTSPQLSVSQSGSPESPFQLAVSDRAISITVGDSCEDEDGKSEGYSWK